MIYSLWVRYDMSLIWCEKLRIMEVSSKNSEICLTLHKLYFWTLPSTYEHILIQNIQWSNKYKKKRKISLKFVHKLRAYFVISLPKLFRSNPYSLYQLLMTVHSYLFNSFSFQTPFSVFKIVKVCWYIYGNSRTFNAFWLIPYSYAYKVYRAA